MKNNIVNKLSGAGIGVAAAKVGDIAVGGLWRIFMGKKKPQRDDYDVPLKEAIAFVAISSAITSVLSYLVERKVFQAIDANNASSDMQKK
ncbi:MAG: DUF4235 domain-containing protein [Actinomycetaceae bacterium]|nr:DUF4235 domain-containing protein [Actinomycetaceae bacterium]